MKSTTYVFNIDTLFGQRFTVEKTLLTDKELITFLEDVGNTGIIIPPKDDISGIFIPGHEIECVTFTEKEKYEKDN